MLAGTLEAAVRQLGADTLLSRGAPRRAARGARPRGETPSSTQVGVKVVRGPGSPVLPPCSESHEAPHPTLNGVIYLLPMELPN